MDGNLLKAITVNSYNENGIKLLGLNSMRRRMVPQKDWSQKTLVVHPSHIVSQLWDFKQVTLKWGYYLRIIRRISWAIMKIKLDSVSASF